MRFFILSFLISVSVNGFEYNCGIDRETTKKFLSEVPCFERPLCSNGGFKIIEDCAKNEHCTSIIINGTQAVCIEDKCCSLPKEKFEPFSALKYVCGLKGHRFISVRPCGFYQFCSNGGIEVTTGCVNDKDCSTLFPSGPQAVCIDNKCCTPPKKNEIIESEIEEPSVLRSVINFVWGK